MALGDFAIVLRYSLKNILRNLVPNFFLYWPGRGVIYPFKITRAICL